MCLINAYNNVTTTLIKIQNILIVLKVSSGRFAANLLLLLSLTVLYIDVLFPVLELHANEIMQHRSSSNCLFILSIFV